MKRILDLVRIDLITMRGGKNNSRMLMIVSAVGILAIGFCFSPLFGLYGPLVLAGFMVAMIFGNEEKYHATKLHSVLPITRRELVNERFLFVTVAYTALFLFCYLLMGLSQYLHLYLYIVPGDGAEILDIISLLAERSNGTMTPFGVYNVLYFIAYAFGLGVVGSSMRRYFKNAKDVSGEVTYKKMSKQDYVILLVIAACIILWVLIVEGLLPLGSVFLLLLQLLIQLAQVADGFLLAVMAITLAGCLMYYSYWSCLIEYEEKEL